MFSSFLLSPLESLGNNVKIMIVQENQIFWYFFFGSWKMLYKILNQLKHPQPKTFRWFSYDSAKFFHKTLENCFSFNGLFYRFEMLCKHVSGGVGSWLTFQKLANDVGSNSFLQKWPRISNHNPCGMQTPFLYISS